MLHDTSSESSGDEDTTTFKVPRRGVGHVRTSSDVSTGRGSARPSIDMGPDIFGSSPGRKRQLQPSFSFDALDSDNEQASMSLTKLHPSASRGAEELSVGGGSPGDSRGVSPAKLPSRGASPSVDDLTDYVVVSKGGTYVCVCLYTHHVPPTSIS